MRLLRQVPSVEMFLFGFGAGRYTKHLIAARVALVAAFLILVFAFHPHGTTLDIVQGVRFLLLLTIIGITVYFRRRHRRESQLEAD